MVRVGVGGAIESNSRLQVVLLGKWEKWEGESLIGQDVLKTKQTKNEGRFVGRWAFIRH